MRGCLFYSLTVLSAIVPVVYGRDLDHRMCDQLEVVDWIARQAPQAVTSIGNDRIYLDPGRLILTEEGVSLLGDDDDSKIRLPVVYSEIDGLYIRCNIFGTWRCFHCGCINSRFVNACQKCHTPGEGS